MTAAADPRGLAMDFATSCSVLFTILLLGEFIAQPLLGRSPIH